MADETVTAAEETTEVVVAPATPWRDLRPKGLEIVPLKWKVEDSEDIPPTDGMPYYLFSSEGLYLVRDSMIGRSALPTKKMPTHLSSMGAWAKGMFSYTAQPIPGEVMAMAVHFFRVVWEKHKTEAELLFLWNEETGDYRLFVPVQRVSGGSVKSVYDVEDIPKGYYVIGSIHSHCNFGAFHSGTDTNDASSFNGLHITVGHVDRAEPEFAVMVAIDGVFFHYGAAALPKIADVTKLDSRRSPEGWLQFLLIEKSVGEKVRKALQEQLERATHAAPPTAPYTSYGSGWSSPNSNTPSAYEFWRRLYVNTGQGQNRKYSNALRCQVDEEFFDDPKERLGEISYRRAPDALNALLEDLERVAAHFDLDLTWEIDDVSVAVKAKEDSDDLPEETSEDETKQLLPGPMEVSDEASTSEETHRTPLVH